MTAKPDHSAIQSLPMDTATPAAGHVKRPMNPFMVWAKLRRKAIAKENPKMHNSEISRKLGEEWKTMPPDEKSVYIEEANRLKEEHKRANPDYKYKPKPKKRAAATAAAQSATPSSDQKLQQKQQPQQKQKKQAAAVQDHQLSMQQLEQQQLEQQQQYQHHLADSDAPIAVPLGEQQLLSHQQQQQQHLQQLHLLASGHSHQQLGGYQMLLAPPDHAQHQAQQLYSPYGMINVDPHVQSSLLLQQHQQQQQQHYFQQSSAFSNFDSSAALDVPLQMLQQHQQQQHHMYSGLTAAYTDPSFHLQLHQQQSGMGDQIPVPSNQSSSAYSADYDVTGGGGGGSGVGEYTVSDDNRQTVPVPLL